MLYSKNSSAQIQIPAHGIINTIAGTGLNSGGSGNGGLALDARFYSFAAIAVDGSGDVYIVDQGANEIREITATTGDINVISFAGADNAGCGTGGTSLSNSDFLEPAGLNFGSGGNNLYIADFGCYVVYEVVDKYRVVDVVAGDFTRGFSGDGGAATSAQLNSPQDVAVDSAGDIFIVDASNARIRKVTAATQDISTYAGDGTLGESGNGGAAIDAELNWPSSIALDASGNVYIGTECNVRVVNNTTCIISLFAGTTTCGYSGDGGLATSAELDGLGGIRFDPSGNLYIADVSNNRIRKVATGTNIITTVAGDGTAGFKGDGGAATSAELNLAGGSYVFVDSVGNLYIEDGGNLRVRVVGH